VIEELCYVVFR